MKTTKYETRQIDVEKTGHEQIRIYHISIKSTKELCDTLQNVEGIEPVLFIKGHNQYNIQIEKGRVFDWDILNEQILKILKDHIEAVKGKEIK